MIIDTLDVFKKLAYFLLPIFLILCFFQSVYALPADKLTQLVTNIKDEISNNPKYQNKSSGIAAKEYIDYVDSIVIGVKNNEISEQHARSLILRSYKFFQSGKYDKLKHYYNMHYPKVPPLYPDPQEIPEKPGPL